MTVVSLQLPQTHNQEIKQTIIDILKSAMADAEAGTVTGLYIVAKEQGHDWSIRSNTCFTVLEEIGALQALIWERLKQIDIDEG